MILAMSLGVAAFLLYATTRCFFRVDEGHLAVLARFGAARRSADGTLLRFRPGLHVKLPWEEVHMACVKEQSLDLAGEEGGRSAMAADGTVLRFDSILRFVPVEEELDKFLFGMKAPLEHVTGLFTCLLRNEIANFHGPHGAARTALAPVSMATAVSLEGGGEQDIDGSSYAVIRRERQALNERIEAFCRTQIGGRYGVGFAAVDLTDILPPDELATALNAVMQARSEAAALYARAESESQQRILSASQGVAVAEAHADAMGIEIEGIARYLVDLARAGTLADYVARRRAEVLGESRVHYVKGGAE